MFIYLRRFLTCALAACVYTGTAGAGEAGALEDEASASAAATGLADFLDFLDAKVPPL